MVQHESALEIILRERMLFAVSSACCTRLHNRTLNPQLCKRHKALIFTHNPSVKRTTRGKRGGQHTRSDMRRETQPVTKCQEATVPNESQHIVSVRAQNLFRAERRARA